MTIRSPLCFRNIESFFTYALQFQSLIMKFTSALGMAFLSIATTVSATYVGYFKPDFAGSL